MPDPEHIGEVVAETIADAIETAQVEEQIAHETAEAIAAAAMETERGARIEAVERRLDQWENNQADTSEAIASMVLGLTELSAKVELLTLQSSPMPTHPSVEDGQKESHVEETPVAVIVEPEAPPVETPAPVPPKKKRHRWI